MADVTIDELIERVRLESGLRNNAYYDTDQILRSLNAGGAELQDLFTATNQKYIIDEFDFSTTGQADAVVALPDNFQQGHSLEIYPDTPGQTRTIRYLSNWLNRNSYNLAYPSPLPGGGDPVYTFLGGNLRFYPPQCTPAAPWRLYYTPTWTPMAAPISRTFAASGGDQPGTAGPGPSNAWLLSGDFEDDDVGGTLTPNLDAPNTAWNIDFLITEVFSANAAAVTPDPNVIGIYDLPSAGTFTITSQPAGTRATLPNVFGPWSEYLVVYAAMAVNIDRQRPIGELERKLQALKARVSSILDNRQEEPQQPPLTRGVGGWDGGGNWGGGGGWG